MSSAAVLEEPETAGVAHSRADAELLARARAIIAGRIVPPPMEDAAFDAAMAKEFAGYEPPPTEEGLRPSRERGCLEKIYKGQPVLTFKTAPGHTAVIASGEHDIFFLLRSLPDSERARVVVEDTEGWVITEAI